MKSNYAVIIVGGSYAGLSAAMALGRSLREVLIIDSGLPCNRQTPHSHNFITQDGVPPAEIAAIAREQVLQYKNVNFITDLVVSANKVKEGFQVETKSGKSDFASKVIFATGVKDEIPQIKGFSQCWGISIIHCPYCHGYEFRNNKTGIMASGDRAFHLASLVANLTDQLYILTNGKADFTPEQLFKLDENHINIIESEILKVKHHDGHLQKVVFKNQEMMGFDALYAAFPFSQHCELPELLGCELTEHGHIKIDEFQKTTVEGIYACGDNSTMMRSVAASVASGNLAGAMANADLIKEQF